MLQNAEPFGALWPEIGPFRPGTGFAPSWGMHAAPRTATTSLMGVIGHPFVPYILVLLAILKSL
jgi:hypothetical protein